MREIESTPPFKKPSRRTSGYMAGLLIFGALAGCAENVELTPELADPGKIEDFIINNPDGGSTMKCDAGACKSISVFPVFEKGERKIRVTRCDGQENDKSKSPICKVEDLVRQKGQQSPQMMPW